MSWYFGTFNDLFYLNQFDHLIVPNTSLMTLTSKNWEHKFEFILDFFQSCRPLISNLYIQYNPIIIWLNVP